MLRFKSQDLGCQIATLIYDKFLIEAYGVKNCDINYKEGDLIEKILVKKVIDSGHSCHEFLICGREELNLKLLGLPATTPIRPFTPHIEAEPQHVQTIVFQNLNPGVTNFVFTQNEPAVVWSINHTLSFQPNVTIIDFFGNVIEGNVQYVASNKIVIQFSEPIAGKALLS